MTSYAMSLEDEKDELEAGDRATVAPEADEDDPPPNGGYGWVVCFAMTCINGGVWGILASYGVWLSYYISHDTFKGTSDLAFTFIGGINFAAAMLVAPFVNILIKKYGTNKPMYAGCVLWALGWVGASFATEYWHLFLSQGLLVGIAGGITWLPAAPVLAQWFTTKRSLAQGIASSGSGIIGVVYSVSTIPMIERISLAWALRITGITSAAMLFIASILMKDRYTSIRPDIHPFDTRLFKNRGVLLLICYTFFAILGYIVAIYSLGAFGTSIGLSQEQSGNIIAILNTGTALGRPLVGVLSDKLGRITCAFAITVSNVLLAFAFWIPISSYPPLVVYALITGGTAGIYWGTIAPLCAEVVPLGDLPSTLALMWLTVSMPSLFSEAIALEIRVQSSSRPFLYPQIYTGLTFLIASLFLLELRRMKWGLITRETHK